MIRSSLAVCLIAGMGAVALPAHALTQDQARKCAVMQRTFDAKMADIETLTAERAAAAEAAETAGEAWENAEPLRDFGGEEAGEADAAKAAWEAAKTAFHDKDAALKSATRMLNRDIAEYNRTCSPNE